MNSIPGVSHNTRLLLFTLIAVVGLIVLIARFKVNSIIAVVLKLAKPRPDWPEDFALNHAHYTKGHPRKA